MLGTVNNKRSKIMNQYYVIYFNDPNKPQVSLIKSDSHTEAESTVKNMWDHSIKYITSILVNGKNIKE
jgi:hypothetical protein